MEEFKAITGSDDSIAQYYLNQFNGNLEIAVNKFLEEGSSAPVVKQNKEPDPAPSTKLSLEEKYRACMVLSGNLYKQFVCFSK